jgi:hypothetical protein
MGYRNLSKIPSSFVVSSAFVICGLTVFASFKMMTKIGKESARKWKKYMLHHYIRIISRTQQQRTFPFTDANGELTCEYETGHYLASDHARKTWLMIWKYLP